MGTYTVTADIVTPEGRDWLYRLENLPQDRASSAFLERGSALEALGYTNQGFSKVTGGMVFADPHQASRAIELKCFPAEAD